MCKRILRKALEIFCIITIIIFITSCDNKIVFAENISLKDGWEREKKAEFVFKAIDTINPYNIFIMLRNNEEYPYSNIFVISTITTPEEVIIKDTLEYQMATPEGQWLGKGTPSNKESLLWLKENIFFKKGEYTFQIEQANRENGNVNGDEKLKGIKEVGIIVKHK